MTKLQMSQKVWLLVLAIATSSPIHSFANNAHKEEELSFRHVTTAQEVEQAADALASLIAKGKIAEGNHLFDDLVGPMHAWRWHSSKPSLDTLITWTAVDHPSQKTNYAHAEHLLELRLRMQQLPGYGGGINKTRKELAELYRLEGKAQLAAREEAIMNGTSPAPESPDYQRLKQADEALRPR